NRIRASRIPRRRDRGEIVGVACLSSIWDPDSRDSEPKKMPRLEGVCRGIRHSMSGSVGTHAYNLLMLAYRYLRWRYGRRPCRVLINAQIAAPLLSRKQILMSKKYLATN